MIFILEYDRREGKLIDFHGFGDSQRPEAEELRFRTELDLNRKGLDHDVVLLDAESEETLRQTHRRFFETLSQLLKDKRPQSIPFSEEELQKFRQSEEGSSLCEFLQKNGHPAK